MLAQLHNINYEKVGLKKFGKLGNYAERQIIRWEKQWHLSKQRELPEIDIIVNWLNQNIPKKFENSIVHGDFRLGNLIYNSNQKSIKAQQDKVMMVGDLQQKFSQYGDALKLLEVNPDSVGLSFNPATIIRDWLNFDIDAIRGDPKAQIRAKLQTLKNDYEKEKQLLLEEIANLKDEK